MKEKGRHIDDVTKRELGGYTAIPKGPVWEKLEQRLTEHATSKKSRGRRKRYMLALVLVLFVSGIFVGKEMLKGLFNKNTAVNNKTHTEKLTNNTTTTKQKAKLTIKRTETDDKREEVYTHKNINTTNSIKKEVKKNNYTLTKIVVVKQQQEKHLNKAGYGNSHSPKLIKTTSNKEIKQEEKQNEQTPVIPNKKVTIILPVAKNDLNKKIDVNKNEQTPLIIPAATLAENNTDTNLVEKNNIDSTTTINIDASSKVENKKMRLTFDLGMKVGIEKGLQQFSFNTFSFAPYITFNTGGKISFMVQPTIKLGSMSGGIKADQQSLYAVSGNNIDSTVVWDTVRPRIISRNYYYKQNYDSIVVTHTLQKQTHLEIELPVLFKYQVNQRISVFGGPVFSYSNIASITSTRISVHLVREDSLINNLDPVPPPDYNTLFVHTGVPYSSYTEPAQYKNAANSSFALGYMLGFNYAVNKKLGVELLVEKKPMVYNNAPNSDIQKLYTQPYIRLSIGYLFFSKK